MQTSDFLIERNGSDEKNLNTVKKERGTEEEAHKNLNFGKKKFFWEQKKRNTIQIKEEGQLNAEEFPIILN